MAKFISKETKNRLKIQAGQLSTTEILFGVGASILAVLSLYGLGISWSCLMAATLFAMYKVNRGLDKGEFEKRNSFENVYSTSKSESKQKRMLAKRKEKYEKKLQKQSAKNNFEFDGYISQNHLPSGNLSRSIYESNEFEDFEQFNEVFNSSGGSQSSGKIWSQNMIPSLRSPQPLLSAFQSRISKRESFLESVKGKNGPLSPRSVFENLQNRTLPTHMDRTWTLKEAQLFGNRSFDIHKAMSPPSGRYFSQIRPGFEKDSTLVSSKFESPLKKDGSHEKMHSRVEKLDGSYSKETVMKALQQKTASKRKRPTYKIIDFTEEETEQGNKKRRVQDEKFDSTINEFYNEAAHEGSGRRSLDQSSISESKIAKNIEGDVAKKSDEQETEVSKSHKKKNRYGIDENDVESISEEENMEIDKRQSKRKAVDQNEIQAKGKKNRAEAINKSPKKSVAKQTPKLKKSIKEKKTPVRTVETQTPTKVDDESVPGNTSVTNSPKTPIKKLAPYKKIFISGFPSNLKPGTTEKRRKVPLYHGSLADIENIEMGREEYGEQGVSCEAFTADRKAAAERTLAFINGEEDDDDSSRNDTATSKSSNSTNQGTILGLTETTQHATTTITTTLSSFPNLAQSSTSLLSNFSASSSSKIQFGQPASSVSETAVTTSAQTSLSTNPSQLASANKIGFTVQTSSSSNASNTTPTISFGMSTSKLAEPASTQSSISLSSKAQFTSTASSVGLSTSAISFGTPAQPNAPTLAGGFTFGAVTSTTSSFSGTPSFKFGQSSETIQKQSPLTATSTTSTGTPLQSATESQAKSSASGGFSFGLSADNKQSVAPSVLGSSQTTANSATGLLSSVTAAKPAGGFSFGATTDLKQPSLNVGAFSTNTVASSNTTSITTTTQASTNSVFGGFGFGTVTTSLSKTPSAPSAPIGGFSFGVKDSSKAVSATNSEVSSTGLGGFKFDTGKTTGPSGGFSFGTAPSGIANSAKNATGTSLFGTAIPASSTTASLFQTPTTKSAVSFGSSVPSSSSVSTNLFGTASTQSTQSPFGTNLQTYSQTQSIFGAQNSNQAASVFGTPTQSASTTASIFGTPQPASTGNSLFGASAPASNSTGSLFSAPAQNAQQTGSIFGGQTATSSSASIFGTPSSTTTFSFGGQNKPIFGTSNVAQTSSATGGFSFGTNTQAALATGASSIFGQSGQSGTQQNPFGGGSVFGQATTAPATSSAGGFSFGSSTQNPFGQSASNPPDGAASSVFGSNNNNQGQTGGFNFSAAASTQKPSTFSFGAGAGIANSGFASRPGTPTPFGTAQPSVGDMFTNPQPGGFAIGSGTNRPTVKGRRRVRK